MLTQDTWKDEGLAWGSHLPALIACVAASDGPVLELGAGNYSTPCLRALCSVMGRELVTVEKVDSWMDGFRTYECPTHKLLKLTPGLAEDLAKRKWGVVFVDDFPDDRVGRASLFFSSAQFMLFHDYNFSDMKAPLDAWLAAHECNHFVYTAYGPHTLIVSNKTHRIPVFCP